MNTIETIQKAIVEIYKNEKIEVLSGMDGKYILPNGKQLLLWNAEIISEMFKYQRLKNVELNKNKFNFHKNLDNLLFNSDEVAYFAANTFLYKDRINNPIDDQQTYYDNNREKWITYYPHYPNLESKRYSMYVSVAFEKIYNYWDRIGDLIWATYFQNDLKEVAVDFNRVIDNINNKYPTYNQLESFKWLLNFKQFEYKSLNEIRKNIVHYTSIDIEFKWKHSGQFINSDGKQQNVLSQKDEIMKIMDERKQYYNIIKNEISNTLIGFIKAHEFIEEITKIKLIELQT